jgi:succinoglycan biosynthesis protein ExoW
MSKKVSVVIPFFQREAGLLRKAVESALKQTGDFRMEIVIVDDESPIPVRRELDDLLARHPDKFVIVEQKNAGCFPAGNSGLNHVSPDSDYVAFIDSDDEWFDGHIEHAVWALDQGYDLYFSDFYQLNQTVTAFNRAKRIDVQQHPRIHPTEPIHQYRGDMVNQIITGSILGTSTIVYNLKTFADVRYLENYKHTGPEYIFWIQLALRSKKIAFSAEPECRYGGGVNIFSEASWGSDKFISVRHEEIKWRKHLLMNFPLPENQKKTLIVKIQESRLGFAKGLLHNLLHNGKVNGDLLLRHAKLDPKTFLLLPIVPAKIVYDKLNRPEPPGIS